MNTQNIKCLCIELDTVAAPPRMRQSAAHVISSSGREMLNAVYDVTDSNSEGSGMNWNKMLYINTLKMNGKSIVYPS